MYLQNIGMYLHGGDIYYTTVQAVNLNPFINVFKTNADAL
jgi:hypothetical protein